MVCYARKIWEQRLRRETEVGVRTLQRVVSGIPLVLVLVDRFMGDWKARARNEDVWL